MSAFADLRPRFLRLALINILSNITVPIAGLVDTAMLGHLSHIHFLAGVALASVLFDLLYWSFGFLRMGTTGTTAQAWGRGDSGEVYLLLYRSLVLAGVLAAALLFLQVPLREAGFALLSGSAEVEAAGRAYFNARIWAAPATLGSFVLVGWFLGREESRHVLVMTIAANVTNIFFNYIFIVRLQLAAYGAGLATLIAQYVMLAVGIGIYARKTGKAAWVARVVFDRRALGALLRLNRDILLRTLCLVAALATFTNFSSMMGTQLLAANSILLRLFSMAAYLIDGAAFATESLAGILRGRRHLPGLRRLVRLSMVTGLGFSTVVLTPLLLAPELMLRVLTSHDDVIALASTYALWLVPVLLVGALAFMYDGLFLGLTEGRLLRNSMLISTGLGFLPLALLALYLENNHLLWGALALFMAVRTLTLRLAERTLMQSFARW